MKCEQCKVEIPVGEILFTDHAGLHFCSEADAAIFAAENLIAERREED